MTEFPPFKEQDGRVFVRTRLFKHEELIVGAEYESLTTYWSTRQIDPDNVAKMTLR